MDERYLSLKGVVDISSLLLNQQLEYNLVSWLDWCLLGVGNFYNVQRSLDNQFSNHMAMLKPVSDPYYNDGQVWAGKRANWVYEQNISFSRQPIHLSGVYVDGGFYPLGSALAVDYQRGRVIFTDPISTTSEVSADYSYKYINVYSSNTDWFRYISSDSFIISDPYESGVSQTLAQNRVQLPAIVVELPAERQFEGLQLGGGQWVHQAINWHLIAENTFDRNMMVDITSFQNDRTILLYDTNAVLSADRMPLNDEGGLNPSGYQYPELLENFAWNRRLKFEDSRGQGSYTLTPSIFAARVRATASIDCPEL